MDSKSTLEERGPVQVWIEENDSNFQLVSLSSQSTLLSTSLCSNVSTRDIFFSYVARNSKKKHVQVLLPGSQVFVDIPAENIYMCHHPDAAVSQSAAGVADDMLAAATNLPSVLLALRARCEQGVPLVRLGPVYVALRPTQASCSPSENEDKGLRHVKSIVGAAMEIVGGGGCASVVLSGCSGSGKSFRFRQLLRVLCTSQSNCDSGSGSSLDTPLLAGVAVLEAFGTCRTKQNADSSRFGKYLRLKMQRDGLVLSASVSTFCLERRVAAPAGDEAEESFHVFTLLLASVQAGVTTRDSIGVYPDMPYRGCRNQERVAGLVAGCEEVRVLCAQFQELVRHLAALGLQEGCRTELFRVLGAILLLRHVTFINKPSSGVPAGKDSDASSHDDSSECMVDTQSFEVQRAAELLGVRAGELGDLLCKKFVTRVRKEDNYFVHLTFAQARQHIAMVAENLYDSVFSWLATHCTAAWGPRIGAKKLLIEHYVDVLDFAPISEGVVNGLHQLMTNYCCEKLHKYYCSSIFREEMLQHSGGLCLDVVGDCCLSVLDGEAGVLSLVDEHCLLSREGQDDHTLFQLINSTHAQHSSKHFSRGRVSKAARAREGGGDCFCIRHHSGPVSYNTRGFMRRNKGDKLGQELRLTFETSSNSVLADIFGGLLSAEERTSSGDSSATRWTKNTIKRTEISLTKRKVSEIMSDVQTTKPIFLKCIKTTRSEGTGFDSELVAQQLHAHGVVDLITLKMQGFSETYSWEDVHAMLVANDLYHFRDLIVLRAIGESTSSSASKAQRVQLAKDLFSRCQAYMQISSLWATHPSSSDGALAAGGALCSVQVEAFEYLLHFKKCSMKDLICKNFSAHRKRQFLLKRQSSRRVLSRFFCSLQLRRRWQRSTTALLQRFLPLKLFLRRWALQYRVLRRRAARILHLFLRRRDWKDRLRALVENVRAEQMSLQQAGALLIQKRWRGCRTRLLLHDSIVVQVRSRLRARVHCKMAGRIYRAYRRFSLKSWLDDMVHAIRWDKLSLVGKLLFCDPRVSRRSLNKVNIRQQRACAFASLLHTAVGLHRADITHVLLLAGADPFASDSSGLLPATCLFESLPHPCASPDVAASRPSLQHAYTASVLLHHCPQLATYPCKDLQMLDATEFRRQIDEFHHNVQCGDVTLSVALGNMITQTNRAALKKNYMHQLQSTASGCSLIDLIDPADWTSPLVMQPPPFPPLASTESATRGRPDHDLCVERMRGGERERAARRAAAAEEDELTAQKQAIRAAIFPKDVAPQMSAEEQEEVAAAAAALAAQALAAEAAAAARLEQRMREEDVACRRARLRDDYYEQGAKRRQALVAAACWRESESAGRESFSSIVAKCDPNSTSSAGSNRGGGGVALKSTEDRRSAPRSAPSPQVAASAQLRRRAAKRRELEKDATLQFLNSR